ncbi:hypothetical protein FRC09_017069, partial [Ceratobasidium sp. 395]
MESEFELEDLDIIPRPVVLGSRHHIALECLERTGYIPRKFQVDFVESVQAGKDVVCVAGTGSGKSLAFVIVNFFTTDVITWIVSPLNVIENQMAVDFSKWGLKAVAVNSSTITDGLLKEIKRGDYQVVISSPEAYKDANKLRGALLSDELANIRHVTIVDKAHTIRTWGGSGFRKDFERIGDMRIFLPAGNVMCAATATMSQTVRDGVIKSLHIKPDHADINLGNWRANLRYGARVMEGGQTSYSEILKFFDKDIPLQDTGQVMVFAEDYAAVHHLASVVRKHYGLKDQDGSDLCPVFHSLLDEETKARIVHRFKTGSARVLFTTEALTMGADFPHVQLVLNFLSPALLEIWIQRAGRGARLLALLCLCLVLVTKSQVKTATELCKKAGIEVDPVLLAMKVEEDLEAEATQKDSPAGDRSDAGNRSMSLGMAEYIATAVSGGCVVDVIDRYFSNPKHTPCVEVGGCESCYKRREDEAKRREEEDKRREEEAAGLGLGDVHCEERQATRDKEVLEVSDSDDDYVHKEKKKPGPEIRPLAERRRFLEGILAWRKQKFRKILEDYDLSLDEVMTTKAAERIAKLRLITVPNDFDKPEIKWPGLPDWRLELLDVLSNLQLAEDIRVAEAEEAARLKAEAKALDRRRKEEERIRKKQEKEKAERKRIQEANTAQQAPQPAPAQLAIPAGQPTPTRPG